MSNTTERRRKEYGMYSRACANTIRQEALKDDPRNFQRHFGRAASRLISLTEQATSLKSAEKHRRVEFYNLYGSYTNWITATNIRHRADTKGVKLSKKEKDATTEAFSKFNDSLREVFDSYGTEVTPAEVLQTLEAFIPLASSTYHREKMKDAITGVRTEMLTELALTTMGLETRRATPEEDRNGIDYFVEIGNREVPLDIKTSQRGARKANRNNALYGDETIAICPFSQQTLRDIPTVLPGDPYKHMLEPSREMLGEMLISGVVNGSECAEIDRFLKNEQTRIEAEEKRGVYA